MASPKFISTIADKTVAILNVRPLHLRTSGKPRTPDFSDAPCCVIKQCLLPGSCGAALAAHKPEPQGPDPKFAERLSVHAVRRVSALIDRHSRFSSCNTIIFSCLITQLEPSTACRPPSRSARRRKHSGVESAIDNLEQCGLNQIRRRGSDGFELAVGLSASAFNIRWTGQSLSKKERKRSRQRKCVTGEAPLPEKRRSQGNRRRCLRRRPGNPRRTRECWPRNRPRCRSENTLEDLPNRSGQLMAYPESTDTLPDTN